MSLWIYGINSVSAVLETRPKDIKEFLFVKSRDEKKESDRLSFIRQKAHKNGIRITEQFEEEALEKIKVRTGLN
ncbi:MAG: RNA methyltransferase substrate-binding domain-containing protein, partial [bacterium]